MKFESPPFGKFGGLFCGLGLLVMTLPATLGEGLSLRVADTAPPALDEFFGGDFLPDFKGGIYSGMMGSVNYDSNLFLDTTGERAEFYLELEPWLAYRTDPDGEARCSLELLYAPIARVFWDEPHLDSYDNAGSASFRFLAGKTELLAYVSYAEVSGPDRLAGGYINGSIFSYGLRGSYQVAPKTKLLASFRYASSDYETAGQAGTDSYLGSVGFDWYSGRRFSFGASIEYSLLESISIGDREAWAILGNVGYQVTDRIDFEGSLGIEFAEDSRGGGSRDTGAIGKMNLVYRISDRWRWNALARYRTVPSPSNLNYLVDDLLLSTSISRQLHVGELEAGIAYSVSQYKSVGIGPVLAADNEKNWYVFLGYRRPFFSERVEFSSLISYTSNTGLRDWDQWLLSIGLSSEF